MNLIDLNPRWVGAGGPHVTKADGGPIEQRYGVGINFDCPCGCSQRVYIPFKNPMDGKPAIDDKPERPFWDRIGETFEELTLIPSIYRPKARGGCGWHGFVTKGKISTVIG